ncbi:MAG TPA: hypothetical protein PKM57_12595 [Kiritimatiellia bacterium]|nr:hypothetical protein [Kiritimatiellia bacterium]HPS07170.1 hypothetical protein [Kiritimatiellia bacterium]
MDALEAGDLEYNISLAAEWLVTGEMHEDHVRPVGIKNKPELGFNTRRRWLLPDSSLEVFHRVAGSRGLTELSVTGVRTLGDAIEAVRGCVARRRPDEPWPRDVVCLHVAIGDDPSPVLRLLALTNPRELHLWSLDKSSEAVSALHDAVRETYPRMAVRIHGNIPAAELDKISRALHDHFGANPATTSVLFDITDGAWLFRVAVEAVSRRSHFAVVCKVSESNSYIKLWNERGVPHYCHLATALSRPARPGKRHPVDRNVVPRSPSSLLGELRTVDQLLGNDQEV